MLNISPPNLIFELTIPLNNATKDTKPKIT